MGLVLLLLLIVLAFTGVLWFIVKVAVGVALHGLTRGANDSFEAVAHARKTLCENVRGYEVMDGSTLAGSRWPGG